MPRPGTIRPLSDTPRELVEEYFLDSGWQREIVSWKYYDDRFSQGRERGLVWLRNGKVEGFIGLIPFRLANGEDHFEGCWTCDWSLRDPQKSAGMGIVLLRKAMGMYQPTLSFGGNENTRRLVPRLARITFSDAGHEWILPLRLGFGLPFVQRLGIPSGMFPKFFKSGRLPRRRIAGETDRVVVKNGVSGRIMSVLDKQRMAGCQPLYDLEYIKWQTEWCPDIAVATCLAGDPPVAASIIWGEKSFSSTWRIALWVAPGGTGFLQSVLKASVHEVLNRGGTALQTLVSRKDTELSEALKKSGFWPRRNYRPLYILSDPPNEVELPELAGLSFLDTDLAYRFPGRGRDING